MIYCFCDNFFERAKYPKFYEDAVAMMRGANHVAFSRKEDFDVFVHRLKRTLEKHKPEGHAAHVHFCVSGDRQGQISIESGKVDTSIARISFEPVKKILEYNLDTGRFHEKGEWQDNK